MSDNVSRGYPGPGGMLNRIWGIVTARQGWRHAGAHEYAFATRMIRQAHGALIVRIMIGSLAAIASLLSVVVILTPAGPQGALFCVLYSAACLGGLLLGVGWLFTPRPSVRQAILFVVLADVLIGFGVSLLSDSAARIVGSIVLFGPGLFIAYLLGWRILLLHCSFALLFIAVLSGYSVMVEGESFASLYVNIACAMMVVVGTPIVFQLSVEIGRRTFSNMSKEWYVDSVTDVYNRRGMAESLRQVVKADRAGEIVIVAMLDLDEFKKYNDTFGHLAGDELLRLVAARLKVVPRTVVARNGGDEFMLLAVRNSADDVARTVEQLSGLVSARGDLNEDRIAGSMGIVVADKDGGIEVESLASMADAALYEAKRSAVDSVVVRTVTGR